MAERKRAPKPAAEPKEKQVTTRANEVSLDDSDSRHDHCEPPQTIVNVNIGGQPVGPVSPVPTPAPKRSFRRSLLVTAAIVVGCALIAAGVIRGWHALTGSSPVPDPTPPTVPTPPPPPPLSHVAPTMTAAAWLQRVRTGNQDFIDIEVDLSNVGNKEVAQPTITLLQGTKAIAINDPGNGWSVSGNHVVGDTLGRGASTDAVLEIVSSSWNPLLPIRIQLGGNGVANAKSQRLPLCPSPTAALDKGQIACG